MTGFDENRHPRGGHPDNKGKFSLAQLDEVSFADLDGLSDTGLTSIHSAVESAIARGELSGETWIEDDKVAYRDQSGEKYLAAADSDSVWAYPESGSEFEAEYFSAHPGKIGDIAVKSLRAARTANVSREAWGKSINAYRALSLIRGAPFVQNAVVDGEALVVNPGNAIHETRFGSFDAHDEIHDGRASMSIQLTDADADHSYVMTCDPATNETSIHRGYDIEEMPHWEASAVLDQVRARTGLDARCIADMIAAPARDVDSANALSVPV